MDSLASYGEVRGVVTACTVSSLETRLDEVHRVHHRHLANVQVVRLFHLLYLVKIQKELVNIILFDTQSCQILHKTVKYWNYVFYEG